MILLDVLTFGRAVGLGLMIFFATAILIPGICLIIQYIWAWIDDGVISKSIWITHKLNFSKWKYPIYDESGSIRGYAKDEKYKGCLSYELTQGKDYVYVSEIVLGGYLTNAIMISFVPMLIFLAINFSSVALVITLAVIVAFLARFSRRLSKKFVIHIEDINAHKGK